MPPFSCHLPLSPLDDSKHAGARNIGMVIKTKFGTENRGVMFDLDSSFLFVHLSLYLWSRMLRWSHVIVGRTIVDLLRSWATNILMVYVCFLPLLPVFLPTSRCLNIQYGYIAYLVCSSWTLWHDDLGVHAHMGPDPLHGGNIGRLKVHPRNCFSYFIRLSSNFSGW